MRAALPDGRFVGTIYRALNPLWMRQPLSGEGARRHGGRFNARGTPALYTALTPEGAMAEANQAGRPFEPVTLVAYEADLGPVLDATLPLTAKRLTQLCELGEQMRTASARRCEAERAAVAAGCILI